MTRKRGRGRYKQQLDISLQVFIGPVDNLSIWVSIPDMTLLLPYCFLLSRQIGNRQAYAGCGWALFPLLLCLWYLRPPVAGMP